MGDDHLLSLALGDLGYGWLTCAATTDLISTLL